MHNWAVSPRRNTRCAFARLEPRWNASKRAFSRSKSKPFGISMVKREVNQVNVVSLQPSPNDKSESPDHFALFVRPLPHRRLPGPGRRRVLRAWHGRLYQSAVGGYIWQLAQFCVGQYKASLEVELAPPSSRRLRACFTTRGGLWHTSGCVGNFGASIQD